MDNLELQDEIITLRQQLKEARILLIKVDNVLNYVTNNLEQKIIPMTMTTSPKLAVIKGICPFDMSCNLRNTCTKDKCSADTCSGGYAYKMS